MIEEEIISMVKEGHEQGVLMDSEAEMIHNIFEYADKEANPLYPVPKLMNAKELQQFYYKVMER